MNYDLKYVHMKTGSIFVGLNFIRKFDNVIEGL